MVRTAFRGKVSVKSGMKLKRAWLAPVLGAFLASCIAYERAPVEPAAILAELEAALWPEPEKPDTEAPDPKRLASFAIANNPTLQALRSAIGVSKALLVEAGLLEDPEIGWDGMDALASHIVEGRATTVDFLSGFGLTFPLPRPGELDAKKGAAKWRVEETRRKILEAERILAREVLMAAESVLETRRLLEQNQELIRLAERTRDYFKKAKEAGAATAIQANLAEGDLLAIKAQRIDLEARLRRDRQRLNTLLGLPPDLEVPLSPGTLPESPAKERKDLDGLVRTALEKRPDLGALLASYEAAEDEVRLEVARQFPKLAIGTGLSILPGLFTFFNRPAIRTAIARRTVLAREIRAKIHAIRNEVHDTWAALEEARTIFRFLEKILLPNNEESLRLAGEAFDAGEVTLLEILNLQRALVDARRRTTEARSEIRKRTWGFLTACGTVLAPPTPHAESKHDGKEEEEKRTR